MFDDVTCEPTKTDFDKIFMKFCVEKLVKSSEVEKNIYEAELSFVQAKNMNTF